MTDGRTGGAMTQGPAHEWRDRVEQTGGFVFQRCTGCASAVFFPRTVCPVCASRELGWETASGEATVYAATVVHARGVDPYNVAIVETVEGARLMTTVVDVDPDAVHCGMNVRLEPRAPAPDAGPDAEPAFVARPATEVGHD